jgi:hypothetical protein
MNIFLPMKFTLRKSGARLGKAIFLAAILLPIAARNLPAADEQSFNSPEEAVNALVAASTAHDTNALHAIFGPEGHEMVSPDAVQATEEYQSFVQRLTEKCQLVTNTDASITLDLGTDGWPFPIPLVQTNDHWFFDTDAGKSEILSRRIGMNELGAIAVCHAYVDAQREYASQDRLGDGVPAYAQLLRSTTGHHDGLFWPTNSGGELSPLGPLVAAARGEGYHHTARLLSDELAPYHGYYFKILTRQGKHAPGGKYDYVINGRMIAGFALVAWPAEWGNSGVMTFMVNDQGKVYQRNLGKRTAKIAAGMTRYDPDSDWTLVP